MDRPIVMLAADDTQTSFRVSVDKCSGDDCACHRARSHFHTRYADECAHELDQCCRECCTTQSADVPLPFGDER